MTEDRIEPKIAETGFFKTVHDIIDSAVAEYRFLQAHPYSGFNRYAFRSAYGSLLALYNTVVYPHNQNNGGNEEVVEFEKDWGALDKEYGGGFEQGLRGSATVDYDNDRASALLTTEYFARYSLIMVYLNTLGITQLRQRGENWQDERIEARTKELK